MRQNMNASQKKPLLEEVKHGINAAIECGIRVKINVVLTPQTDVVALTRYVAKKRYRYPLYRDDAGR